MGVVYMAEQEQPVRRKVALKIIKPGMDSAQVVARFEAERQAPGRDGPHPHRQGLRRRHDRVRPPLLRHGAGPRRADHQVLRRQPAHAPRAPRTVRPRLPGDPARAPEGDHPPRHQAVERPGDDVRRPAGAQGDRLRRGQGDRAAADRADAVYPVRRPGRHVRVHEPRAGRDERLRGGHAERHLLAGRAALRAADRHDAAGEAAAARGGPGRAGAADQGGGAAAAERAALRLGRPAEDRRGAEDGAGAAVEAGARRGRLDRDEVPGEGPDAARTRRPAGWRRTSSTTCTTSRWRRARRRPATGCGSSRASTSGGWRPRRSSPRCWCSVRPTASGCSCAARGPRLERAVALDRARQRRTTPPRPRGMPCSSGTRPRLSVRRPRTRGNRCGGRCTPRTCNWPRKPGSRAISPGCATCWRSIGRSRACPTSAASSGITSRAGHDRPHRQAGPGRELRTAQSRWDALRLRGDALPAAGAGGGLEDRAEAAGRRLGPAGAHGSSPSRARR